MELLGYRKLIAYQKSKELVRHTYRLLDKFPTTERYALCDQLRRSSISITSKYSRRCESFFVERETALYRNIFCVIDGGVKSI